MFFLKNINHQCSIYFSNDIKKKFFFNNKFIWKEVFLRDLNLLRVFGQCWRTLQLFRGTKCLKELYGFRKLKGFKLYGFGFEFQISVNFWTSFYRLILQFPYFSNINYLNFASKNPQQTLIPTHKIFHQLLANLFLFNYQNGTLCLARASKIRIKVYYL